MSCFPYDKPDPVHCTLHRLLENTLEHDNSIPDVPHVLPSKQGYVISHQSLCFSEASTNVRRSFLYSPKRMAWTMYGRSWSSEAAQADMR